MTTSKPPEEPWYSAGLRFECTRCGNCCTGPTGPVWFTPEELGRMSGHFGLLPFQFLERYARKLKGRWTLAEVERDGDRDCVFLERDPDTVASRCSIYRVRPRQCQTWPFWKDNVASPITWRRTQSRCPGTSAGDAAPLYSPKEIEERF